MKISVLLGANEALLLARLLRPRVTMLTDLLDAQVRHLPQGDASWAFTADELATAQTALQTMENAAREAGA